MITLKKLFLPIMIMVILVGLFIYMGKYLYERVSLVNQDIKTTTQESAVVREKLSVLLSSDTLIEDSLNKVSFGLPVTNASLHGLSQVRFLAENSGLSLVNLKVGAPSKEGEDLSKVAISFDVDGEKARVFDFLGLLSNSAPINKIEKVKVTASGGDIVRGSISTSFYWASYPVKFPAIHDPVKSLSQSELETLSYLTGLKVAPISFQVATGSGALDTSQSPFEFGD